MSLLDPTLIPGYAEATRQEQEARDLAFLGLPIPLCGIIVRQFTPRHLILLTRCRNRFLVGGVPQSEDIAAFLWQVSTAYAPGDAAGRVELFRSLKVDYAAAVAEIRAYLAAVFQDAPKGRGPSKLYTSAMAYLVHTLAKEYGWDDDAILEKPLARLWQYYRHLESVYSPNAAQFNPSDRLMAEWLKTVNERGQN